MDGMNESGVFYDHIKQESSYTDEYLAFWLEYSRKKLQACENKQDSLIEVAIVEAIDMLFVELGNTIMHLSSSIVQQDNTGNLQNECSAILTFFRKSKNTLKSFKSFIYSDIFISNDHKPPNNPNTDVLTYKMEHMEMDMEHENESPSTESYPSINKASKSEDNIQTDNKFSLQPSELLNQINSIQTSKTKFSYLISKYSSSFLSLIQENFLNIFQYLINNILPSSNELYKTLLRRLREIRLEIMSIINEFCSIEQSKCSMIILRSIVDFCLVTSSSRFPPLQNFNNSKATSFTSSSTTKHTDKLYDMNIEDKIKMKYILENDLLQYLVSISLLEETDEDVHEIEYEQHQSNPSPSPDHTEEGIGIGSGSRDVQQGNGTGNGTGGGGGVDDLSLNAIIYDPLPAAAICVLETIVELLGIHNLHNQTESSSIMSNSQSASTSKILRTISEHSVFLLKALEYVLSILAKCTLVSRYLENMVEIGSTMVLIKAIGACISLSSEYSRKKIKGNCNNDDGNGGGGGVGIGLGLDLGLKDNTSTNTNTTSGHSSTKTTSTSDIGTNLFIPQEMHISNMISCLALLIRRHIATLELDAYLHLTLTALHTNISNYGDRLNAALSDSLNCNGIDDVDTDLCSNNNSSRDVGLHIASGIVGDGTNNNNINKYLHHSGVSSSSSSSLAMACLQLEVSNSMKRNCCLSPFCGSRVPSHSSAKITDIDWNIRTMSSDNDSRMNVGTGSGTGTGTSTGTSTGSPWEDWAGVGVSIWVLLSRRSGGCESSGIPTPIPPRVSTIYEETSQPTFIVCAISLHASSDTTNSSSSNSTGQSISQHLTIQIRNNRLEVILRISDNHQDDILSAKNLLWMSTVVFPTLPDVSTANWHHICFGVVRQRDVSRITVWLDGMSASCVTPKYDVPITLKSTTKYEDNNKNNNSNNNVSDGNTAVNVFTKASVVIAADVSPLTTSSSSSSTTSSSNNSSATKPSVFQMLIGPFLILNQPISLSHVVMVLYAAGPAHTAIFVGEQGDGSVPLFPGRCSYSLLEALEKKNTRDDKTFGGNGGSSTGGGGQSKMKGLVVSAPAVGAFADVESGPLLDPSIVIGCKPSQLILGISNRWHTHTPSSSSSVLNMVTAEDTILCQFMKRRIFGAIGSGSDQTRRPILLTGNVIDTPGSPSSQYFSQMGYKSLEICLQIISQSNTQASLYSSVKLYGSIISAIPSLRGIAIFEHYNVIFMSILEKKVMQGLFTPELCVEIGKLCCSECISKKNVKKKNIDSTYLPLGSSSTSSSRPSSFGRKASGNDLKSSQHSRSDNNLLLIPNSDKDNTKDTIKDSQHSNIEDDQKVLKASSYISVSHRDVLLLDPPLLSLILSNKVIWTQVSPECLNALLEYLCDGIFFPGSSFNMYNRRQLIRARATRALVLLTLDSALKLESLLCIITCLECILAREFTSSEDLLQLVNVATSLALTSPAPSGSQQFGRTPSFGEAEKSMFKEKEKGFVLLGRSIISAATTATTNTATNVDGSPADGTGRRRKIMDDNNTPYYSTTGGGSSNITATTMHEDLGTPRPEAEGEDAKLRLVRLLRVRHAIFALLTHSANVSHAEAGLMIDTTSTSNIKSTNIIDNNNSIQSPSFSFPSSQQQYPNTENFSEEVMKARGQRTLSTLINSYSFSKILYILFQFSDISPTKHSLAISRGPVKAIPKRRDPFTGLLTLQMMAAILPHISGAMNRSARMEWGMDMEVCLPGLLTSLFAHGGGATETMPVHSGYDSDNEEIVLPDKEKHHNQRHSNSSGDERIRRRNSNNVRTPSKSISKDKNEAEGAPASIDLDDRSEVAREISEGNQDGSSETSSVSSSCPSPLASPLVACLPCSLLPLRRRGGGAAAVRKLDYGKDNDEDGAYPSPKKKSHMETNVETTNAMSASSSLSLPLSYAQRVPLYYDNTAAAVLLADESSIEDLVIIFAETVTDSLLGRAGATACIGEYLLQGWNVTDIEPHYTPPNEPPPMPLPSYVGICSGAALGAYLAVAREAARCSTQVSLLHSRKDLYVKFGSWPHPELEKLSSISSSLCATLLCCLSTLLRGETASTATTTTTTTSASADKETGSTTNDNNNTNNITINTKTEEEGCITSIEDFDVLIHGIIQIFYAAARARFLEALGPQQNLLEVLRTLNAEEEDPMIPNEVIYGCCGSTIGRLCIQQLTCLTVAQSMRGHKALDWEQICACIPLPMHPPIPRNASSAMSLILNAAIRRRHLVAMSYLSISIIPKISTESDITITEQIDIDKRILSFLNSAVLILPNMMIQAYDSVVMEIELDRHTVGGISNPNGRIFLPIKSILELCRRILLENKRLKDLDKDRDRDNKDKDKDNSSAKSSITNNAISLSSYINLGLAGKLLSKNSESWAQRDKDSIASQSPSQSQSSSTSTSGVIESNSTSTTTSSPVKPSLFGDFFRKTKGPPRPAPQTKDYSVDVDQAIGLARIALCHILEEYFDNMNIVILSLRFMLEWVDLMFSWRRSVKEEDEMPFIAYIVWRLYLLLYDDNPDIRSFCMRLWSLLLRSTLGTAVRSFLTFNISSNTAIDLWKYDDGGFYLLYVDLDVLITNRKDEIQESIFKFQAWLGSLSDQIRSIIEEQLSLSATPYANIMKISFENLTKNITKKWLLYRTKLVNNYDLLISRLNKSHPRRRKEAKDSQAVELQRQRRWRHASRQLCAISSHRKDFLESSILIPDGMLTTSTSTMPTSTSISTLERSNQQSRPPLHIVTTTATTTTRIPLTHVRVSSSASLPVVKRLKQRLLHEHGLQVLDDDNDDDNINDEKNDSNIIHTTRARTRNKTDLVGIISLGTGVGVGVDDGDGDGQGEWAIDPRFGPYFMRKRLRRSNLVILRLKDTDPRRLELSTRSSSRYNVSSSSGYNHNRHRTLSRDKLQQQQYADISQINLISILPHKDKVDNSNVNNVNNINNSNRDYIPQSDMIKNIPEIRNKFTKKSSSSNVLGVTDKIIPMTYLIRSESMGSTETVTVFDSAVTIPVSDEEKITGTGKTPNPVFKVDEILPFVTPGDKLLYRYRCSQVMGLDSYESELFLGTKLLYLTSTTANAVHTDSSHHHHANNGGDNEADMDMAADNRWSHRNLLYFKEYGHQLRSDGIQVWLPVVGGSQCETDDSQIIHNNSSNSNSNTDKTQVKEYLVDGKPTKYLEQWKYVEVVAIHRRRHLLSHVAIEIFWTHGRSNMLVFESVKVREDVASHLLDLCPAIQILDDMSIMTVYGPPTISAFEGDDVSLNNATTTSGGFTGTINSFTGKGGGGGGGAGGGMDPVTESWVQGRMSNFDYLMYLNVFSGRTYRDWSQYPVMPWVLKDYTSAEIDLSDSSIYRDFSKPMGAQSVVREREARAKYAIQLQEYESEVEQGSGMGVPPFHFGTHFASSAAVMHYLIRLQPFSSHALTFQGGKFDHPDRVTKDPFTATTTLQDVTELIPEFFYLPDFLDNVNGYDFGSTNNGIPVHNVELPPWANNSPREFVRINREALENPYVSAHLHHWIDLIFGIKQRGRHAEEACNVYHFLSYEGGVDLSTLPRGAKRQAYEQQIRDFGQTPSQIFKHSHPQRQVIRQSVTAARLSNFQIDNYNYNDNNNDSDELLKFSSNTYNNNNQYQHQHTFPINADDIYNRLTWFTPSDVIAIPVRSVLLGIRNDVLLLWKNSIKSCTFQIAWPISSATMTTTSSTSTSTIRGASSVSVPVSVHSSSSNIPLATATSSSSSSIPNVPSINPSATTTTSTTITSGLHADDTAVPPGWIVIRSFDFSDRVGSVGALVASDSGRVMLTASADTAVIHVWKVHTNILSPQSSHASNSNSNNNSSYNLSNSYNASSEIMKDVFVIDRCIPCHSHTGNINSLALCTVHEIFISCCTDGVILLWSLYTLACRPLILPHTAIIPIRTSIMISRINGDIFIAQGHHLYEFDINGQIKAYININVNVNVINRMDINLESQLYVTTLTLISMNDSFQGNDGVLVGCSDGSLSLYSVECNIDEAIPMKSIFSGKNATNLQKEVETEDDDKNKNNMKENETLSEIINENDNHTQNSAINKINNNNNNTNNLKKEPIYEEVFSLRWQSQAFTSAAVTAIAARPINKSKSVIRLCAGSVRGEMRGWDICVEEPDVDEGADLVPDDMMTDGFVYQPMKNFQATSLRATSSNGFLVNTLKYRSKNARITKTGNLKQQYYNCLLLWTDAGTKHDKIAMEVENDFPPIHRTLLHRYWSTVCIISLGSFAIVESLILLGANSEGSLVCNNIHYFSPWVWYSTFISSGFFGLTILLQLSKLLLFRTYYDEIRRVIAISLCVNVIAGGSSLISASLNSFGICVDQFE
eukprot:gene1305-2519_t